MNLYNDQLKQAFQSKSVLKVITGINNTNINNVMKIAKAAELSRATYLDIAANVQLVKTLKRCSNLPICVSSINPIDLYNCVLVGADLVEVGNYDYFYHRGIYLTVDQILELTLEVKSLIKDIDICVTIPYYIGLSKQVDLAKKLKIIGVNIIQTEGISKFNKIDCILPNLNNTFIPSLLSTYCISKFVDIPIITASGCNNILASIANLYGASGVGIGASIQQQSTLINIIKYLSQARKSINGIQIQKNILNLYNSNLFSKMNK